MGRLQDYYLTKVVSVIIMLSKVFYFCKQCIYNNKNMMKAPIRQKKTTLSFMDYLLIWTVTSQLGSNNGSEFYLF